MRNFKFASLRKITVLISVVLMSVILFGIFSFASEGASSKEAKIYSIIGDIKGKNVVVSGEHVYDGQTLDTGTRFSVNGDCDLIKVRRYYGAQEHGIYKISVWDADASELIASYDWNIEKGENAIMEFELPEPIKLYSSSTYVVSVLNNSESPYYDYIIGLFENMDFSDSFFEVDTSSSVFSETPGAMPVYVIANSATFVVDVVVSYVEPDATPTPAPTPTKEPATDAPKTPDTQPAKAATKAPETTEAPTQQEEDGSVQNIGLLLGLIVSVTLNIILVILLVLKRKK